LLGPHSETRPGLHSGYVHPQVVQALPIVDIRRHSRYQTRRMVENLGNGRRSLHSRSAPPHHDGDGGNLDVDALQSHHDPESHLALVWGCAKVQNPRHRRTRYRRHRDRRHHRRRAAHHGRCLGQYSITLPTKGVLTNRGDHESDHHGRGDRYSHRRRARDHDRGGVSYRKTDPLSQSHHRNFDVYVLRQTRAREPEGRTLRVHVSHRSHKLCPQPTRAHSGSYDLCVHGVRP